jgi:TonB family protein
MSADESPQPPRRDRRGAMTIAMQAVGAGAKGPKVLRIGVIRDGRIVAERIVRGGDATTIGSSEHNDVVVQGVNVPARFALFRRSDAGYILSFTEAMSGRVGRVGGGVVELDQLRSGGAARPSAGHWELALNESSRGKVVIADTTLLFQFVVAPPVQSRPQLPAAVRAGMVRSIDWLFTAFIVATFMVMFGFIIVLENADWPVALSVATVPEEYALPIFAEPGPPPPERTDDATDDAEDVPPEVDSKPREQQPSERKQPDSRTGPPAHEALSADEAARIAKQATSAAEALVVGALGAAIDGLVVDVLAGGAVPGSAQDVLSLASGVDRATSLTGTLRERNGGARGSGQLGIDALATAGGPRTTAAQREGRDVVEGEIRGRTVLETGGDIAGSGDFDAALVVRKIRAQINAIKACYERELKSNPTLAGKVAIEFTIEERGTVSGVKVTTNSTGSPAVGSCVANAIERFRFNPGPQGGPVTFSYPFVFAPQG